MSKTARDEWTLVLEWNIEIPHCCLGKSHVFIRFLISLLAGGYKLWKRLSFFVALPAVGLCMLNTYLEHQKMTVHRPEFVKYEYLRIRNKRFPWGDGTKSLFHVSDLGRRLHRADTNWDISYRTHMSTLCPKAMKTTATTKSFVFVVEASG